MTGKNPKNRRNRRQRNTTMVRSPRVGGALGFNSPGESIYRVRVGFFQTIGTGAAAGAASVALDLTVIDPNLALTFAHMFANWRMVRAHVQVKSNIVYATGTATPIAPTGFGLQTQSVPILVPSPGSLAQVMELPDAKIISITDQSGREYAWNWRQDSSNPVSKLWGNTSAGTSPFETVFLVGFVGGPPSLANAFSAHGWIDFEFKGLITV